MRKILFLTLCLGLAVSGYGAEEPEFVIEMNGSPSRADSSDVTILQKSARQLERLFRGKTQEEMLVAADSVPSAEKTLQAPDEKQYHFVQFGDEHYRKCLFDAQKNNTLLACTDNLKDTLSLQRKYKLPIPISIQELTDTYGEQLRIFEVPSADKKQTLVQLPAGNKKEISLRYLYQNGRLIKLFLTDQEMKDYLQEQQNAADALKAQAAAAKAEQIKKAKAEKQAALKEQQQQSATFKALLSGGTLHDRMYMPHVISAPPGHMPSTQSNASSGSRSR